MSLKSSKVSTFQSTPSVGRATAEFSFVVEAKIISIHALRGEGDVRNFIDRFPCTLFQSTPSVGRATRR